MPPLIPAAGADGAGRNQLRPALPAIAARPGTSLVPRPGRPPSRPGQLPPVHTALIGVALPGLVICTEQGQLTGQGLEGFYRAGRRLLSRCRLTVAGRQPLIARAGPVSADAVRFVATLRTTADSGPDPDVIVECIRHANGTERITLRSTADRALRLPVEVSLGTDLADLGAVAAGRTPAELPATVHGSGLRWVSPHGDAAVTADPPPLDAVASAGLLRWELELPPGGSRTLELKVRTGRGAAPRPAARGAPAALAAARATGDDHRVRGLLDVCVADLRALLLRDHAHPGDVHLAGGVPWRPGLAAAEALTAARMALPLGTRLAAGTLRTLARTQETAGPRTGLIPGPMRDSGPHLPPGSTAVEATLMFPVLLAEARRWGLPDHETEGLLPTAERCLAWLRVTVDDRGYLADRRPGGMVRCDTQAHAHRAALLGADLLEACGREGADELRQWAGELRTRFREDFWTEGPGGGRPAAALGHDGRPITHLGCGAVPLLDTGLLGDGAFAQGLLDKAQTEQLARLLGGPAIDSGWGLRGLGAREALYNPFGHRAGAVRVQETATAAAGLAAAGHEEEACVLVRGLLAASDAFGHRLPEMFAGEPRTEGGAPLPHPAACRPAATAAAAGVQILMTLVGIRPDVPAGTVTLRPLSGAPLGEVGLTGLRVAGAPFSVRVTRRGLAMVEEAAQGLQLGV
ncbi:glycogen debranching N-terminal domain-containing protein [Streptomyces sp. NPDC002004]